MYIILVEFVRSPDFTERLYVSRRNEAGQITFADEPAGARKWRTRTRAQRYYEAEFAQFGISGCVCEAPKKEATT